MRRPAGHDDKMRSCPIWRPGRAGRAGGSGRGRPAGRGPGIAGGPRCRPSRAPPTWSPRWTAPPSSSSSSALLGARPDDGVLGEEGSDRAGTSGVRWIIDPLDGTTNYVYRHPGVRRVDRGRGGRAWSRPGWWSTWSPGTRFRAVRGTAAPPATASPISVSAETDLARALVATGFGYQPDAAPPPGPGARPRSSPEIRDIRRMGSAALDLCSVACRPGRRLLRAEPGAAGTSRPAPSSPPRPGPWWSTSTVPRRPRPLLAAPPGPGRAPAPALLAAAGASAPIDLHAPIGHLCGRIRPQRCPICGNATAVSASSARKSGTMERWEPESWPSRTTSASAPRSSSRSRTRAGWSRRPTTARTRSTRSAATRPTSC